MGFGQKSKENRAGPVSAITANFKGNAIDSHGWVPEVSLAGFFGGRHLALELVCGADFSCKLMCGAGPGDLGGSPGSGSAENRWKTGRTIFGQAAFRYPASERPLGMWPGLFGGSGGYHGLRYHDLDMGCRNRPRPALEGPREPRKRPQPALEGPREPRKRPQLEK